MAKLVRLEGERRQYIAVKTRLYRGRARAFGARSRDEIARGAKQRERDA
ncbi:hypothetical protein Herbaro_09345 [Herbaspirillum sp. WKF16]|nr:hypothetical protein [Herbaspirillum sp. WKF16]WDZ97965.1 hypothetical protein Herbaro_09345 [Herbaspirillum sp. WKF16]